jgi:hypothetical protein
LSPYLFVLSTKVLSSLLAECVVKKEGFGFIIAALRLVSLTYVWWMIFSFSRRLERVRERFVYLLVYLFLSMEILSSLLAKCVVKEGFGYYHRCSRVGLTQVCFANDLFIFSEASVHYVSDI